MGREAAGMRKNAWRGQVGETLEGSAPAQEDNGVDQRLGASPCPQLDTSAFRKAFQKLYVRECNREQVPLPHVQERAHPTCHTPAGLGTAVLLRGGWSKPVAILTRNSSRQWTSPVAMSHPESRVPLTVIIAEKRAGPTGRLVRLAGNRHITCSIMNLCSRTAIFPYFA